MNNNVRKNWLISFYVFHIGLYVVGLINQFLGEYVDGFPRGIIISERDVAWVLVCWLFLYPIYHLIIGGITYHFAYLKKGTIWLSIFSVLLATVSMLMLSSFVSYGRHDWSYTGCPYGIMAFQIFFVYLSLYYLYNCHQLYKLNGGFMLKDNLKKGFSLFRRKFLKRA